MTGDIDELKAIQFGRIAPTVTVSDMAAAIEFYLTVFGFEKTIENGNPVGFALLEKDKAELDPGTVLAATARMEFSHFIDIDDARLIYRGA